LDWFKSLNGGRISISGSDVAATMGFTTGTGAFAFGKSAPFLRPPALALLSFCVYGCFYRLFDIFSIFSL
jgi:hypothetical protein